MSFETEFPGNQQNYSSILFDFAIHPELTIVPTHHHTLCEGRTDCQMCPNLISETAYKVVALIGKGDKFPSFALCDFEGTGVIHVPVPIDVIIAPPEYMKTDFMS